MARNLVFGYMHSFDGVSATSGGALPLRCRLRSGNTARILTLSNGVAVNVDQTQSLIRFPIEQELELIFYGVSGNAVDDKLDAFAQHIGKQASLGIRVPGGLRTYSAPAVLDNIEIVGEGDMRDDSGANYCVARLTFFQMELWN